MYDIKEYYEAENLEQALETLAADPNLIIVAGGTDVLIKMHHGRIEKARLLSIRRIKPLAEISVAADGTINIGPLATFTRISRDAQVRENLPILVEAALSMGGPQIRNVATIGGNICNGATSADSAPTLFALNARLALRSKSRERLVPINEFYLGPGKVDLRPGEILAGIRIDPAGYRGFGGHYIKFSMRKAMDIATLGVAVTCRLAEGNVFAGVRIGLGVAGPAPLRCREAEEFARGKDVSAETIAGIGRLAVKSTRARTSWRASREYREHLVVELVQRALKIAVVRAGGVEIV